MPERKISGEMTDHGLGIELPADDTSTKAKEQGKAKPPTEWTAEDFLAMGVKAQLSQAKTRTVNTATSIPGLQRTGIEIGRTKGFKFAK
jgi:hypothetical protein